MPPLGQCHTTPAPAACQCHTTPGPAYGIGLAATRCSGCVRCMQRRYNHSPAAHRCCSAHAWAWPGLRPGGGCGCIPTSTAVAQLLEALERVCMCKALEREFLCASSTAPQPTAVAQRLGSTRAGVGGRVGALAAQAHSPWMSLSAWQQ